MWKDYWHKCRLYAENEFETVKKTRAQRGQRNANKIKHQTAVGKMGELIACDWLREQGYTCSDPDFNVYSGRKKSWDSDMHIISPHGKFKVACKAQDEKSAKRYGRSWIFQKGGVGYGHTDPVIKKGESLSVFVSLNLEEQTAEVKGPFRMCDMRPLFREPFLKSMRFSKVALYWEDMKDVPVYDGMFDRPAKRQKVETPHVIYVLDRSGSMKQFGDEGYGSVRATIEDLPKTQQTPSKYN